MTDILHPIGLVSTKKREVCRPLKNIISIQLFRYMYIAVGEEGLLKT